MGLSDSFDTTYVINLDRDSARLRDVNLRLSELDLSYERFPAVDGAALTTAQLRSETLPYWRSLCTPAMIGCFLSHRNVWRKIVERDEASALILEDDVVFENRDAVDRTIDAALGDLPGDWDVLYLGCFACDPKKLAPEQLVKYTTVPFRKRVKLTDNLVIPDIALGTHAYAVSDKGARRLLQLLPLASYHLDVAMTSVFDKMRVYAVAPTIAFQADMSSSGIMSKAPAYLNRLCDIRISKNANDGRTVAWLMSEPMFKVPGTTKTVVTGWTLLFFATAIGSPLLAMSVLTLDIAVSQKDAMSYVPLILAISLGSALRHYTKKS